MRRRISLLIGLIIGLSFLFFTQQWWENRDASPSEQLFVYGTLTNPWVRFYACRCRTPYEPLTITGFRVENRHLSPATSDDVVSGQLLTVTPVELARFDRYERVPQQYVRVRAAFIDSAPWVYLRSKNPVDVP